MNYFLHNGPLPTYLICFKLDFSIHQYTSQLLELLLQNAAADQLQFPGLYHQSKVKSLQYTLSITKLKLLYSRGVKDVEKEIC